MAKQKYTGDSSMNRQNQESNEGLEKTSANAPSERFQDDQQIQNTNHVSGTNTPSSQFVKKELQVKGSQTKQEVASEVLTGKGAGPSDVSSPANYGLKVMKFSGDTGTLLGSASGTPTFSKSAQGDTRVEKRLSDTNKDINYLASEQVVVAYENVPPLAGSDSTVGYNGNPKNLSARSQKKSGYTSAELLYDRSLDFIAQDQFVFTSGQVVKQQDVSWNDYPSGSYVQDATGKWVYDEDYLDPDARGNYAPTEINVEITRDDKGNTYVSSFSVEEIDATCYGESYETVNKAATNHQIDVNCAELTRQTIDANSGSPTSTHFNPLGRSVKQPSQTVMFLRDVESSMGATIFAAYKFAQKSRGHYLNRTVKDGQSLVAPAVDALYGHLMGETDSISQFSRFMQALNSEPRNNTQFFSRQGMAAGSAALLINIFDSVTKYKTKADIITQPRSLKMHLQTADNNMDPFRCKREFIAALNSVDAYSTIDRAYDPMSCVCITDKVRLVYPYSWRNALGFTRSAYNAPRTYSSKLFTYAYSAGSGLNQYYIKVGDPILNGVAYFLEMHANAIFQALDNRSSGNGGAGTVQLTIPTVHSTMNFSLWDYLVCASTPYIIYERTNALKDILDYEMFNEYPFKEFVSIKEANPMNAVNYGNTSALEPLTVKQMLPSSAIRWSLPEKMCAVGSDWMLPFYFSEDSWTPGGTNSNPVLNPTHHANYSTPVVRSGVRLAYLDDFWGMEAKDSQLCYDRMVRIPFYKDGPVPGYIYKYSQDSEGLLVLKVPNSVTWTHEQYYATPRQLGWFMPALPGDCRAVSTLTSSPFVDLAPANRVIGTGDFSSFRAIQYKGVYTPGESIVRSSLGKGSVSVSRGQSFTQMWAMRHATSAAAASDYFDLTLSIEDAILRTNNSSVTLVGGQSLFQPYIFNQFGLNNSGEPNNIYTNGQQLFSIHKVLWTILQKLPFVINPFDDSNSHHGADPFGYAYVFNLAGFMAANYDEEDYNRQMQYQNQGYLYTKDPFIASSPVFIDAYRNTQVG